MRQFLIFDYSKFPIMQLSTADFEPTMAEFEGYLNDMEHMYNTYDQFVLIFDASNTKYVSGEMRARQVKWIKDHDTLIKSRCVGMVYVLPNVMIQIIFKCIVTFSPFPVRFTTVRTMDAGFLAAEKFLVVTTR